jgi:hypothetical protein
MVRATVEVVTQQVQVSESGSRQPAQRIDGLPLRATRAQRTDDEHHPVGDAIQVRRSRQQEAKEIVGVVLLAESRQLISEWPARPGREEPPGP